jgi:signal transduction histidine kinase/FixJ family two-component response regulator
MITASLIIAGDYYGTALFFFYLWVIIGYAYRFGPVYMWFSVVLSILAYIPIFIFTDYWETQLPLTVGQIAALIMIPFYTLKFIKQSAHALDESYKSRKEAEIAKKEAINANEQKSIFLANMSHELRAPLHTVIGISERLIHSSKKDKQYQIKHLVQLNSSAEHLMGLINNVLDLSQIESGKHIITNEAFNLYDALEMVVDIMRPQAENKGLNWEFTSNISDNDYYFGDERRVRQVILNVCHNSVKFTNTGKISLNVNKVDSDAGIMLTIIVEDTGVGIDEKDHELIFELFEQINLSTTKKHGGTGLGLPLVSQLVKQMGGHFKLAWSTPGEGSKFIINIPLQASTAKSNREASIKNLKNSEHHILIADDDPLHREMQQHAFAKAGFNVTTCSDGLEAINLVKTLHFDAALLDYRMPSKSGLDVAKYIRESTNNYAMAIAILTGDATKEVLDTCMEYSDDVFIKPLKLETLVIWADEHIVRHEEVQPDTVDNTVIINNIINDALLVDLNHIEKNYVDGNKLDSVLLSLLDIFKHEYPPILENIYIAFKNNDYASAKHSIHNIKSGISQLGAVQLFNILDIIYKSSDESISENMDDLIKHINLSFNSTVKEFDVIIKHYRNIGE